MLIPTWNRMRVSMDCEKLENFYAVARHLSFTKAADELHVSQGTVSKRISALEDELGVLFFTRKGNSIQLTTAGLKLKEDAQSYINQYRFMETSLKSLSIDCSSKVTVGVGHFEFAFLASVLRSFTLKESKVGLSLMYYSYNRLVNHSQNSTIDIGVGNHLCSNDLPNLRTFTLVQCPWLVCAHEEHPFWSLPKEQQRVLQDQLIITTYNNDYEPVRPYCVGNKLKQKAFSYSNNFVTIASLLEAGSGIALLPQELRSHLPKTIRMDDMLAIPFYVPVNLFYNPLNHNPGLELLLDCFKEQYPHMQ